MDPTVLVAIITSSVVLAASAASVAANLWIVNHSRRTQLLDQVARYRDPLVYAAFDLRSKLYSITERHALCTGPCSKARDQAYQWEYTLFVISQYLGWAEVLRRGIQFLDLGKHKSNQKLAELLHSITSAFATETIDDTTLWLERGVQRAIGELMISAPATGDGSFNCMGYATFHVERQENAAFAAWLGRVESGLKGLTSCAGLRTERLVKLHSCLTELIVFLDKEGVRFPGGFRHRLELPPPPKARHESQAAPSPSPASGARPEPLPSLPPLAPDSGQTSKFSRIRALAGSQLHGALILTLSRLNLVGKVRRS